MLNVKNLSQWASEYGVEIGEQLKDKILFDCQVAPGHIPENKDILEPIDLFICYLSKSKENDYLWSIYKDIKERRIYLVLEDKRGCKSYGSVTSQITDAPREKQVEAILEPDLKFAKFLSALMTQVYIFGKTKEEVLDLWGRENPEIPPEEVEKWERENGRGKQISKDKDKEYSKEELEQMMARLAKLIEGKVKLNPGETAININDPRLFEDKEPEKISKKYMAEKIEDSLVGDISPCEFTPNDL